MIPTRPTPPRPPTFSEESFKSVDCWAQILGSLTWQVRVRPEMSFFFTRCSDDPQIWEPHLGDSGLIYEAIREHPVPFLILPASPDKLSSTLDRWTNTWFISSLAIFILFPSFSKIPLQAERGPPSMPRHLERSAHSWLQALRCKAQKCPWKSWHMAEHRMPTSPAGVLAALRPPGLVQCFHPPSQVIICVPASKTPPEYVTLL